MARPVHMRCKAHHIQGDMISILDPVEADGGYTGTKL
jgi:hypothetical protein